MKATISTSTLCELHILRNRLEAGESILQCLSTMGEDLTAPRPFLEKWSALCRLMLEGRVLPARVISDLIDQLETEKKLVELAQQKTLSPRIQAGLSASLIFLLALASYFLFPAQLRPSRVLFLLSLSLCALSALAMNLLLRRLRAKLCFLEWIFFLRGICLSLQCGLSFHVAVSENLPDNASVARWPADFGANIGELRAITVQRKLKSDPLWGIAARAWNTLVHSHEVGMPMSEMLRRLALVQENVFRAWIQNQAEKLSYLLLLPLFLLSVPAVLILLFGPLLSAL